METQASVSASTQAYIRLSQLSAAATKALSAAAAAVAAAALDLKTEETQKSAVSVAAKQGHFQNRCWPGVVSTCSFKAWQDAELEVEP